MARKVIPYGQHAIGKKDIDAVIDVLENRFLTQGELVPKFEESLVNYTGCKYATAVNSGTSGLHIACLTAGVKKGDFVWTVPNSFVASANCALYCGATVDFVDIDPETRNISTEALAEKLECAKSNKTLPKLLIVVHFAGMSCDMEEIHKLCHPLGIKIVEDAAHGLGGSYKGKKIGCCEYSDMTVLSFHPVKSITTAEGGAVTSNSLELQQKLQLFSKHGVTRNQEQMSGESEGPWYYQQVELGYNYRLSDLHAALGISQMNRLDEFIENRTRIARRYLNELSDLPVIFPSENQFCESAWHLFMIEVQNGNRRRVFEQLVALGVGVNVHYIPIHLQPYYQKQGFAKGDFPNAEKFYERAITIPLFPHLSADEQSTVINSLKEVLS